MKLFILVLASAALLGGCAMKQKVLDAQAVSMTHFNLKEGESLQEMGPVTGKFCSDSFSDKGSIGLFDEAIKAAQAQSKADFILNASFWREAQCISVEGTGARVVGGGSSSAPAPARAKRTKRK